MLKFKRRQEWRKDARPINADALVQCVVGDAGFDSSGTFETLRSEVRTLTEIVGRLAALLPESALIELADRYDYERAQSPTQPADLTRPEPVPPPPTADQP